MNKSKYKTFTIISICILLSTSCDTTKSIDGLYGKCKKRYYACSQIELKANNTFEYYIFFDVGGGNIIEGTWKRISNDTILLNTYKQPYSLKTSYTGKINPDLNNIIRIKITEKNEPMQFLTVKINDEEKETDKNGIVEFSAQSVEFIEYSFFLIKEIVEIENPNYNDIDIAIKDMKLSSIPEYITNQVVIVNKKKLNFENGITFQKTKLKNKQW